MRQYLLELSPLLELPLELPEPCKSTVDRERMRGQMSTEAPWKEQGAHSSRQASGTAEDRMMEAAGMGKVEKVEHGWRALVFGKEEYLFDSGEKDGENAASCLDLVRKIVRPALLAPADGTAAVVAAEEAEN